MNGLFFYSLRPLPKKTLSDVRVAKYDSQQFFFEEKSNLLDIINDSSYDLHEFIKTQKGSK